MPCRLARRHPVHGVALGAAFGLRGRRDRPDGLSWAAESGRRPTARAVSSRGVTSHLLLIAGRSGVGKSSATFALHDRLTADGVRHAVIEGDLLDLAWPAPWEHRLAERNLAAVWANYRELGYERLIYTNTVSVLHADEIAAAMGDDPVVTSVLLTAPDDVAHARLSGRETGGALAAHVQRSDAAARTLDAQTGSGVHRASTDGRTVAEVAAALHELWLSPGRSR